MERLHPERGAGPPGVGREHRGQAGPCQGWLLLRCPQTMRCVIWWHFPQPGLLTVAQEKEGSRAHG